MTLLAPAAAEGRCRGVGERTKEQTTLQPLGLFKKETKLKLVVPAMLSLALFMASNGH